MKTDNLKSRIYYAFDNYNQRINHIQEINFDIRDNKSMENAINKIVILLGALKQSIDNDRDLILKELHSIEPKEREYIDDEKQRIKCERCEHYFFKSVTQFGSDNNLYCDFCHAMLFGKEGLKKYKERVLQFLRTELIQSKKERPFRYDPVTVALGYLIHQIENDRI